MATLGAFAANTSKMYLEVSDQLIQQVKDRLEFIEICKGMRIPKVTTAEPSVEKKQSDHTQSDHSIVLEQIKKFIADRPSFNPDYAEYSGFTPVHYLAGRGNVMAMKFLKEQFPTLNLDMPGDSRWTPIVNACYFGQLESVQFLHGQGANVRPHLDSRTLAHFAGLRSNYKESVVDFTNKRTPLLHFLSSIGIDLEATDSKGRTYRDFASYDFDQIDSKEEPLGRTLLHWAAYTSYWNTQSAKATNEARIKVQMNDQSAVRALDVHGKTPLMYSVTNNTPEGEAFFKQLLPLSDVFAQDNNRRTVLHWAAAKSNNTGIVLTLLNKNLDPFEVDAFGQNAFDIAFKCGCAEVLQILQRFVLNTHLIETLNTPNAPAASVSQVSPQVTHAYSGQRVAGETDADVVSRNILDAVNARNRVNF